MNSKVLCYEKSNRLPRGLPSNGKLLSEKWKRFLFLRYWNTKTSSTFFKSILIWEKWRTKLALQNCYKCSFSQAYFSVWHVFQRDVFGGRKGVSKNKERLLLSMDWFTKASFIFSKYIFYEKLWALSQDLFFSQNRARDSFLVSRNNKRMSHQGPARRLWASSNSTSWSFIFQKECLIRR